MDTTVIYYGSLITETEELSLIQWSVIGIFAELDQGIPPEQVNEFESVLDELETSNDIHVYSDVDHAFANPSGERYCPDATIDTWQKTIEFLEMNLEQNYYILDFSCLFITNPTVISYFQIQIYRNLNHFRE